MSPKSDLDALYGLAPKIKIKFKTKVFSEVINLLLIAILYFILFTFIGQKLIIPKFAKAEIIGINDVFVKYADEKGYIVKTNNKNYGFIEIDEEIFVDAYLKEHPGSGDLAYEKYVEARTEILTLVKEDATFKIHNTKFNSFYYVTFIITIFIPILLFEFLIPVFDKNKRTLGMILTKTTMTNSINNETPNNLKLLPRFLFILFFENIALNLFFGTAHFIVILLVQLIFIFASKNRVSIHDLISTTKTINLQYLGFTEESK